MQARLSDKLADNPETRGAASTLAVAHVRGHRAAILNVGDSRVYRASREGRWWRLSKDHTVLQDLIDRGEASPDTEYASLYGMLAHVLSANPEARLSLDQQDWLFFFGQGEVVASSELD